MDTLNSCFKPFSPQTGNNSTCRNSLQTFPACMHRGNMPQVLPGALKKTRLLGRWQSWAARRSWETRKKKKLQVLKMKPQQGQLMGWTCLPYSGSHGTRWGWDKVNCKLWITRMHLWWLAPPKCTRELHGWNTEGCRAFFNTQVFKNHIKYNCTCVQWHARWMLASKAWGQSEKG